MRSKGCVAAERARCASTRNSISKWARVIDWAETGSCQPINFAAPLICQPSLFPQAIIRRSRQAERGAGCDRRPCPPERGSLRGPRALSRMRSGLFTWVWSHLNKTELARAKWTQSLSGQPNGFKLRVAVDWRCDQRKNTRHVVCHCVRSPLFLTRAITF
jgi:hypothetical protein